MVRRLKRMKKLFLLIVMIPVLAQAQTPGKNNPSSPAKGKSFTITGKLIGYADETEVNLFRNGDNKEIASGKIKKGSFELKGKVDEPVLCFMAIGPGSGPIQVYVENSKINITNDPKNKGKYIITGSSSQKDFDQFVDIFTPLAQQASSLASSINSLVPGADRDGLMTIYNNIMGLIQKQLDTFVIKKSHSVIAPFVLTITSQFYEDPQLLEDRFNKLDASVRNLESGKQLAAMIAEKKIGAIGTQAIDFAQPDTTGAMVALSSFRGKYVLVDFWASWCGPCRNENPTVVESFIKFKGKNFTVLGVSLDKPGQKDKWIQAIREDGLLWTQVSDLQWWENAAAKIYHIQGIPQNILVDPNGKIVGRNLRGPALEAKLCEILGCEAAKGF
jgi:peroxiredoxin